MTSFLELENLTVDRTTDQAYAEIQFRLEPREAPRIRSVMVDTEDCADVHRALAERLLIDLPDYQDALTEALDLLFLDDELPESGNYRGSYPLEARFADTVVSEGNVFDQLEVEANGDLMVTCVCPACSAPGRLLLRRRGQIEDPHNITCQCPACSAVFEPMAPRLWKSRVI